jgi:hypothetical protein
MDILLGPSHLVDCLRYRVQVEKGVAQDEVRIRVPVTALVSTSDRDQQALERRIRSALQNFIAVDWGLANIQRHGDAVGFERVTLLATARVKSGEVYNLDERARKASVEGLTLAAPQADYSLPSRRVAEVMQELRLRVLDEVQAHIATFNARTGRQWRIGEVLFGVEGAEVHGSRMAKGEYRTASQVPLRGESDDTGLAASEKIVLIADVTLKAAP